MQSMQPIKFAIQPEDGLPIKFGKYMHRLFVFDGGVMIVIGLASAAAFVIFSQFLFEGNSQFAGILNSLPGFSHLAKASFDASLLPGGEVAATFLTAAVILGTQIIPSIISHHQSMYNVCVDNRLQIQPCDSPDNGLKNKFKIALVSAATCLSVGGLFAASYFLKDHLPCVLLAGSVVGLIRIGLRGSEAVMDKCYGNIVAPQNG